MIGRLRRCLLIPAVGLVLVGAPAFAVDHPSLPHPTSTTIPLVTPSVMPLASGAEPGWTGEAEVSANLVGVKWAGDPSTEFSVEARYGGSDWQSVGDIGPIDIAPDAGTPDANAAAGLEASVNATEPVWVGRDVTAVRVTIVSGSAYDVSLEAVISEDQSAPSGSAGALGVSLPGSPDRFGFAIALVLAGLVLGAFAVGWWPWRSRRSAALTVALGMVLLVGCEPAPPPPPPPPPPAPTTAVPAQPAMTLHSDWGPDLGWNADPECAPGPSIASHLKFGVVHHTVNANAYGPGDSRAMVRAIWQYHVGSLGYCDIAYNFLVDRYGQIFEGRIGGVNKAVIAAHSGGFNTSSTGAAWIGDWTAEQPPQAGWDAMVNLLAWKLSVHKVDPNLGFTTTSRGGGSRWPDGTVVSFPSAIIGHRDVWATACPGQAFYPRMAELRAAVQPHIGWDTAASTNDAP